MIYPHLMGHLVQPVSEVVTAGPFCVYPVLAQSLGAV